MSDQRVRVRFYTNHELFRVSDTPFAVPAKLGRYGLSEVINHLLDSETPQPFDFLIDGQLLRESIKSFVTRNRISVEDVIRIEYIPAVSFSSDQGPSIELQSWASCLNVKIPSFVVVGSYDGSIQFLDRTSLESKSSFVAHHQPIKDIASWNTNESSCLVTASKDHTLKAWILPNSTSSHLTPSANQTANFIGHSNSVESVDIISSTNGEPRLLISGDWNGAVIGWDITSLPTSMTQNNADSINKKVKKRKGESNQSTPLPIVDVKPSFSLKGHVQCVTAIQGMSQSAMDNFTNHSERLFTGSWDHSIKEWDLERQDCMATIVSSKVVTSLDLNLKSNLLLSGHPDGRIRLWDSRQRNDLSESNDNTNFNVCTKGSFSASQTWVSKVRWQPDEEFLFAAIDYQGNIQLWDTRSTTPLGSLETHAGKGLCLEWSHATEVVAENGGDNLSVSNNKKNRIISGGSDCSVRSSMIVV